MTAQDVAAGMRLCASAGWNQLEEDWRLLLGSAGNGGFVAEKDGRVVGTVAIVRYDRLAWIAMMLVDPAERRAGIGARLMEQALSALGDAGCVGLDATPLGEPLYRRCGLVNSYSLVRAKATITAQRFASYAGRARPVTRDDLAGVLARDREVFGADRGVLLAALLERAPECAWIVRDQRRVLGYSFGRRGRLFHQLGPLVAEDREIAAEIVAACFRRLDGRLFAIDTPQFDGEWLAWLESVGFVAERPFVRMFRRGHTHPGKPSLQYAITGPEFA